MSQKWKKFNDSFNKRVDWTKVATDYLGLELVGQESGGGWVSCRHWDGSDSNASCSFNVNSGYFKDFRTGDKAISGFDALIQVGFAKHFGEARAKLAGEFGLTLPEFDKDDPEFGVKWKPWDDRVAQQYCNAKKGITTKGLKRAAARLCVRHGVPCIALPVVDYDAVIVGWMFLRGNGDSFEQKGGNKPKAICKTRDKDNGAFVCDPALMREAKELFEAGDSLTFYWTEGGPDMLAGLSHDFNGEHWFITNCHGTNENINWNGPGEVVLISDRDVPGLAGAHKRAKFNQKVMIPPGPISKDHGEDYRDYLNSFTTRCTHPLAGLNENKDALEVEREAKKHDAIQRKKDEGSRLKRAQELLESVGCFIISVDPGQSITIYSEQTHAVKYIKGSITKTVFYEDMIQFLGYPFESRVLGTQKEIEAMASAGKGGFWSFTDFKRALAAASTDTEYRDLESVGLGIWAVEDEDRERTGETLIVKHGASYVYNAGTIRKVKKPIVGRMIANMSDKINWFDEGKLVDYVQRAQNEEWRVEAYNELYAIIDQWNWRNKDMPQLCIGLMMATWIQTTLKWRPVVALTGESNSGKTVLLDLIDRLFLGLAQFSAQSTAAGVLQNMGENAKPMLIDEFDSGIEQSKLFKHFRVSSRGQDMLKGTSAQDGKTYKVRHIPWIAGIHASSKHQADLNRMIQLSILQAKGNAYTLDLPLSGELRDLGHKILAGVIATAETANRLSFELTKLQGAAEGIQSRYRESYSIPYGCLGAFLGLEVEDIDSIMGEYLKLVVAKAVVLDDAGSDQEALLMDILNSEIRMPKDSPMETASIAEVLYDPELAAFRNTARTKGVGYVVARSGNGKKVCFAGRRLTSKHGVLRATDWESVAGILQILERLPPELEPNKEKQMIAGTTTTCVSVNYHELRKWLNKNKKTGGEG
jgi:hypothetical protein